MKEIIIEIRDFLKADFNIYAYLYTFLFLAIAIYFNYEHNFERVYINKYYTKPISFLTYTLYYLAPYYIILIPVLFIKKQQYKLIQSEFWIKSIIYFGTFGILVAFWQYRYLFNYTEMSYKPFFIMLILIIPLIAIASYMPDFQRAYPQYKFWRYSGAFGMTPLQAAGVFELVYGLDFAGIELLYRGALVVSMSRVLGREAVLPMAGAYVVLHFGKPLGEAISSFFGGFILGVHALEKRNIFGGIVIHVGIAYLMEIAAIWQHYHNL